jgi:hypothetical protein
MRNNGSFSHIELILILVAALTAVMGYTVFVQG